MLSDKYKFVSRILFLYLALVHLNKLAVIYAMYAAYKSNPISILDSKNS
jgi:hypothetical protein